MNLSVESALRGLLDGTVTPAQAGELLARVDAKLDEIRHKPNMSELARVEVLSDIIDRCAAQDAFWGLHAHPSFHPTLLADADTTPNALASFHEVVNAVRARLLTNHQAADDQLSWMTILVEEVSKLTEYADSKSGLRDQLIDVAAVAVQWALVLAAPTTLKVSENGDGTDPR